MRSDKYCIALDDAEKSLLVRCLNEDQTRLIECYKDTEPINEVLLKIIRAKKRKFKIKITEA